MASFPSEISAQLDYSPTSLRIVGEWLIGRYEKHWSVDYEVDVKLLYGAVFYVGETYRKNLGGHWAICTENPELGYPHTDDLVLVGFDKYDDEEIIRPALKVREILESRIELDLKQNLEALIRHYRKKFSQQADSQMRKGN